MHSFLVHYGTVALSLHSDDLSLHKLAKIHIYREREGINTKYKLHILSLSFILVWDKSGQISIYSTNAVCVCVCVHMHFGVIHF